MNIRKTVLMLLVSAALPAFAQELLPVETEIDSIREVCKADIERYCPPAEGAVLLKDCLKKHAYVVSSDCAQALKDLNWRK